MHKGVVTVLSLAAIGGAVGLATPAKGYSAPAPIEECKPDAPNFCQKVSTCEQHNSEGFCIKYASTYSYIKFEQE